MGIEKLREDLFGILHAYVEFLTDSEAVNAIIALPSLQAIINENEKLKQQDIENAKLVDSIGERIDEALSLLTLAEKETVDLWAFVEWIDTPYLSIKGAELTLKIQELKQKWKRG